MLSGPFLRKLSDALFVFDEGHKREIAEKHGLTPEQAASKPDAFWRKEKCVNDFKGLT